MTSENNPPDLSVCPTEPINLRFAALETDPPPVFVDSTGRRRRRLRWLGYGLGVACTAYLLIVGVSIAGGAATPGALLPFPDVIDRPDEERAAPPPSDEARPVGTGAADSDTSVGAVLADAITYTAPSARATATRTASPRPGATATRTPSRTSAPGNPNPAPTAPGSSPAAPTDPPPSPTTPTTTASEPGDGDLPGDDPGTPPPGTAP